MSDDPKEILMRLDPDNKIARPNGFFGLAFQQDLARYLYETQSEQDQDQQPTEVDELDGSFDPTRDPLNPSAIVNFKLQMARLANELLSADLSEDEFEFFYEEQCEHIENHVAKFIQENGLPPDSMSHFVATMIPVALMEWLFDAIMVAGGPQCLDPEFYRMTRRALVQGLELLAACLEELETVADNLETQHLPFDWKYFEHPKFGLQMGKKSDDVIDVVRRLQVWQTLLVLAACLRGDQDQMTKLEATVWGSAAISNGLIAFLKPLAEEDE